MVIDSSALIAILLRESEEEAFKAAILKFRYPPCRRTVIPGNGHGPDQRYGLSARPALDRLITLLGAEVVPFTSRQANLAIEAFVRFGKGGQNAAGLNFGDCCSYALAFESEQVLLFKGDDFAATDVRRASLN